MSAREIAGKRNAERLQRALRSAKADTMGFWCEAPSADVRAVLDVLVAEVGWRISSEMPGYMGSGYIRERASGKPVE